MTSIFDVAIKRASFEIDRTMSEQITHVPMYSRPNYDPAPDPLRKPRKISAVYRSYGWRESLSGATRTGGDRLQQKNTVGMSVHTQQTFPCITVDRSTAIECRFQQGDIITRSNGEQYTINRIQRDGVRNVYHLNRLGVGGGEDAN